MARQSFDDWMWDVNSALEAAVGLSASDLPDCCYRDWYDDGVAPQDAARRAVRNANDLDD